MNQLRSIAIALQEDIEKKSGQVQLTVKGSSNRMLPRFEEPILG